MPFIRLSDNYIDHPKFLALSASAFRLWHEGMAFCRKHQTDGRIALAELQGFRYYQGVRVRELATPYKEGATPLWETVPAGYQVHDYLFWNLSKAEEQAEKDAATKRMRDLRSKRRDAARSPVRSHEHLGERSQNVLDRRGEDLKSSFSEKKIADVDRPRVLLERYRQEWYPKYRHGAKLRIIASPMDFQDACSLCETWDDATLEKLAKIVLTTNDEFIGTTDRSFHIFAIKASWADDRLRQVEQGAAS